MDCVLHQYRKFQAQYNSDISDTAATDKTLILLTKQYGFHIFRRVARFFLGVGGENFWKRAHYIYIL